MLRLGSESHHENILIIIRMIIILLMSSPGGQKPCRDLASAITAQWNNVAPIGFFISCLSSKFINGVWKKNQPHQQLFSYCYL